MHPVPCLRCTAPAAIYQEMHVKIVVPVALRFAAGLLALWCVFIAWLWHFHPSNPNELMLALRDLALAGGLAQFALHGAGRFSLDRR